MLDNKGKKKTINSAITATQFTLWKSAVVRIRFSHFDLDKLIMETPCHVRVPRPPRLLLFLLSKNMKRFVVLIRRWILNNHQGFGNVRLFAQPELHFGIGMNASALKIDVILHVVIGHKRKF